MLDEESLDPRAPSYVAAVRRRRARRLRPRVPRRDHRRLSRDRGGDRATRWSRRSVGSRRASWCSGATTTTRRSPIWCGPRTRPCRARRSRHGDDAAELARAFGAGGRRRPRATGRRARRRPRPRCCATRAPRSRASSCRSRASSVYRRTDTLIIDEQARRHLELTESLLDRRRAGSLIEVLDESRTAMGGRLLRRWLLFPSVDVATIRRRHDAVERLVGAPRGARRGPRRPGRHRRRRASGRRARLGVATPRDLAVLGRSLAQLPLAGRRARGRRRRRDRRLGRRRRKPALARRRSGRRDRGGALARAARRRARRHQGWRLRERGRLARAGRAARHRGGRPQPHRRHRGARARAHRHPVAEGEVQQRVRLLHRGHALAPGVGARGLPAQADRRQRGALRDARAGRVRADDPVGRRTPRRARDGDLHGAPRDGGGGLRAAARARRARRGGRHAGGARRGRPPIGLLPPRDRRRRRDRSGGRAPPRRRAAGGRRQPSSRTTCAWTRPPSRS